MTYAIIATCSFELETVLKRELMSVGYHDLQVQDGRITFQADEPGIARANIFLRTADRVYLKLSEFGAYDFDQLFEGVKKNKLAGYDPCQRENACRRQIQKIKVFLPARMSVGDKKGDL